MLFSNKIVLLVGWQSAMSRISCKADSPGLDGGLLSPALRACAGASWAADGPVAVDEIMVRFSGYMSAECDEAKEA